MSIFSKIFAPLISLILIFSLINAIIHYDEIREFGVENYSFSSLIIELKSYNENSYLGSNYLPRISDNLNVMKNYLNGNFSFDDFIGITTIPSDNDIVDDRKIYDNVFAYVWDEVRDWFVNDFLGNTSISNDNLYKINSFFNYVFGFLPFVSCLIETVLLIILISLGYIILFISIFI